MMEYRNHKSLDVLKSKEYSRHVQAMTAEDLFSKGEIAEELAWRDMQLAATQAEVEALRKVMQQAREVLFSEVEPVPGGWEAYHDTIAAIDAAMLAARKE